MSEEHDEARGDGRGEARGEARDEAHDEARDELLAEIVAEHFESSRRTGAQIELGVAGLHLGCRVESIGQTGPYRAASLFFSLHGGAFGEQPIFASISGYGESDEEAIATGACHWACMFRELVQCALLGERGAGPERRKIELHGQSFHVSADAIDRVMTFAAGLDTGQLMQEARERFGGHPLLAPRLFASETLPVLSSERATLVSVFVSESPGRRVLEVKVNGADWPRSQHLLDSVPPWRDPAAVLMRELAIVVPAGAALRLTREAIERTLDGAVEEPAQGPRDLTAWPGWEAHAGDLARRVGERRLRELELAIGPLPEAYRGFLTGVAERGAGPGYGLLSPFLDGQLALARGTFAWRDGEPTEAEPRGVLALAHAGCGLVWVLVLAGPHRGEVWLDALANGEPPRRVAPDFDAWYRGWLDALVRDAPLYAQWDPFACSTPDVLSQLLARLGSDEDLAAARAALPGQLGAGKLQLLAGDSPYFAAGAHLDPCQGCAQLAADLGLEPEVFHPGAAPLAGEAEAAGSPAAGSPRAGLLGRLAARLRRAPRDKN